MSPVKNGRPRPPSFHNRRQQKPVANEESGAHEEASASAESAGNDSGAVSATTSRPSSRFNIGRPNRLLPGARRGRPTENASAEVGADVAAAPVPAVTPATESSTDPDATSTTQSGLNRLKKRPRIQINSNNRPAAKSANSTTTGAPATSAPVRKLNPLIARRKFAGGASTTSTTEGKLSLRIQIA